MADIRIEYPSVGATYNDDVYGVYEYSTHPEDSVLAGQERRVFLTCFDTFNEAASAYPEAEFCGPGYSQVRFEHDWRYDSDYDDDGVREVSFWEP